MEFEVKQSQNVCKELPPCPKYNPCTDIPYTSTQQGHRLIHSASEKPIPSGITIPKELNQVSEILKSAVHDTTYSLAHYWHYNDNDPRDRADKVSCRQVQYIKPYAENIKVKPPKPLAATISEYGDKYLRHQIHPPKSEIVNIYPDVFCKVQSAIKDQQPPVHPDSEGASKYLDIYVTTSHLHHHTFNPQDIELFKKKPRQPNAILSPRIKPVYDIAVFRQKFIERILPKIVKRVPHTGMESEMKSNYRLPMDDMTTFKCKISTEIPSITGPTKAEILCTPFMYHTEYNTYGTAAQKFVCTQ